MDNYQLSLIKRGSFKFESKDGMERLEFNEGFVLYQNENYKINGYKLLFDNSIIDYVLYKGKKHLNKSGLIEVGIDFNDNESKLTIVFKNELADDCVLPIKYVLSDHNKFDEKEAKANQAQLEKNVALVVAKGEALINLYFKKAINTVSKSIVKIGFCEGDNYYQILETENNEGFLSLTGLAYGIYKCVVEQYDSKNKLVISVEKNIVLENEIAKLKSALITSLDGVKNQVKASGPHTVVL